MRPSASSTAAPGSGTCAAGVPITGAAIRSSASTDVPVGHPTTETGTLGTVGVSTTTGATTGPWTGAGRVTPGAGEGVAATGGGARVGAGAGVGATTPATLSLPLPAKPRKRAAVASEPSPEPVPLDVSAKKASAD